MSGLNFHRISRAGMFLTIMSLSFFNSASAIELKRGYQVISLPTTHNLIFNYDSKYNTPRSWVLQYDIFNINGMNGSIQVESSPNWNTQRATCNGNNTFAYKTIDGYTGFEISPGILFIPYGTISGSYQVANSIPYFGENEYHHTAGEDKRAGTSSVTYAQNGSVSSGTGVNCGGFGLLYPASAYAGLTEPFMYDASGSPSTANIGFGVYVQPGSIRMPEKEIYTRMLRGLNYNNEPSTWIIQNFSLHWAGFSCTVDTPAVVSFGDINPSKKENLVWSWVSVNLGINCNNPEASTTAVTYSVKPKSQSGGAYTLPMISAAGSIAGDIRGFLGQRAYAEAGCYDRSSSVRMDNTPAPLRTISGSENWSENLMWVLCPSQDANPGPASATAVLELDW